MKLLRNAISLLDLEESLTKVQCIAGVTGHAGVRWDQQEVNLLKNDLWLPNVVGRTPD